jgi:hypothetical protein
MRGLLSWGMVFGVALTLLGSSPAVRAAAQPQTLRLGIADNDPFVFTWVDGTDGSVSIDDKTAAKVHDLFANTVWLFLDDGRLIVAKGQSLNDLMEIVTLQHRHNDKLTFYLAHWRSKDGAQPIDLSVNVSGQDPKQAFVEMTFVDRQPDGSSMTHHVELSLQSQ